LDHYIAIIIQQMLLLTCRSRLRIQLMLK